jgi:hypothetical protein
MVVGVVRCVWIWEGARGVPTREDPVDCGVRMDEGPAHTINRVPDPRDFESQASGPLDLGVSMVVVPRKTTSGQSVRSLAGPTFTGLMPHLPSPLLLRPEPLAKRIQLEGKPPYPLPGVAHHPVDNIKRTSYSESLICATSPVPEPIREADADRPRRTSGCRAWTPWRLAVSSL